MTTQSKPLSYPEFVKTTFAYASKSFFLESFQAIRSQEAQTPENFDFLQEENRSLRDLGSAYTCQIDELCLKLDKLHIGLALGGEVMEFAIEFENYHNLLMDPLKKDSGFNKYPTEEIKKSEVELQKEIGDLCYYLQMLSNLYGLEYDLTNPDLWEEEPPPGNHKELFSASEVLIDYIKRIEVYGQEYNPVMLASYIGRMLDLLHAACIYLNTTPTDILKQNRTKLETRYASGSFSTQESAAKADA